MNLSALVQRRYTTKRFDPQRRIAEPVIEQVRHLLRFSPSSTNSQPWHFVVAGSAEGKQTVAKATSDSYAFNQAKVLDASHVVVFCARTSIDDDHLQTLLTQEQQDGRFANDDARQGQHNGRTYFVNLHRLELKDAQHWMEKQVYLALGTLLLGAAALEVDACPIEGFDRSILDRELGLGERSLTSVALVALGYRHPDDFNAQLPKSRLPEEQVISLL
ncbi:oxygen-insensitive NAD(P)H nitroreductase [Marinobacterium arenosum]|uniref:oxygen-insensitive NAD(P)H nitroreductase n=1 Tax=Marinobacterium arenosum TaxID=2862496 RepID=UPI001C985264|nr:oxygen-insensitive NAD(P)H nitroreductase [Marinobacterium arenosum]MBY4676915.1 oxygen-insensitive NAD(P)H nitroreductase [Marinobacterium arenosum]